jgi:hypothetical protein
MASSFYFLQFYGLILIMDNKFRYLDISIRL